MLGIDASRAGAFPASEGPLWLLPEAADVPGAKRVPDLATALRQHPASTLTLVGAGLVARDRDAVLPRDVRWQPTATPRGWVALQPPADAAPGARFEVQAQARGVARAKAELLDPAGSVVDRADVAEDGHVQLSGITRAEGRSVFQLRLLDADGHVVDSAPVPQQTLPAAPLRLQVRASAPGPELKYLRRWAADAGIRVQVQADTGAGLSVGDGALPLDAASLARSDLLLLDERSLVALNAAQLAAVRQALREGLGVLVRSAGAPSASARQRLHDLGLPLRGMAAARSSNFPATARARSSPHDVARSPRVRCRPATAKRQTAVRTTPRCPHWKHWRCRYRAATRCCTIAPARLSVAGALPAKAASACCPSPTAGAGCWPAAMTATANCGAAWLPRWRGRRAAVRRCGRHSRSAGRANGRRYAACRRRCRPSTHAAKARR